MKALIILTLIFCSVLGYSQNWKTFTGDLLPQQGYTTNFITVDESDNSLWIVESSYLKQFKEGSLITIIDLGANVNENYNFIKDIVWVNDAIWGIDNLDGLFKYENGVVNSESLNITKGYTIEKDQFDSLWIGVDGTVPNSAYGYKNGNYLFYNPSNCLIRIFTYNIFSDSYGRIWCTHWVPGGGYGHGYSIRDQYGNWDSLVYNLDGLKTNDIKKIRQDNFGNIWCATKQGLGLFNEVTKTWTVYDKNNTNLPSEYISDLAFDTAGRMWVYLEDTAIAYSYNAIDWTVFDNTNSPIDMEFNPLKLTIDTANNVWVNDLNKLHVFNPDGFEGTWLSTTHNEIETGISLYPNPSVSIINIRGIKSKVNYTIFNITGQQQLINQITNNQLSITHLSKGIYFLHIESESGVEVKRFVKQ